MPFLITILSLGFVIFIHELGHLLAAKKARVGVSEFAVGMGPKLFSFNYGDTMYSLRALPFGGFIKAKGLDDLEPCAIEEDYRQKSVFSRASILAAGSFMNLLLGFIIFLISAFIVGDVKLSPVVNQVLPGLPAESAGILPGDDVIEINGVKVVDINNDVISFIKNSNETPFQLTVLRDQVAQTVTLSAVISEQGVPVIGVVFNTIRTDFGFGGALADSIKKTSITINQSVSGLAMLITGKVSVKELAGPVGIIQIASSQVEQSLFKFFNIMAFISISLGVINLLPFPVLDGGHLLFLLIESIRGKPLSKNVEVVINNTAAAMLIGLMVFIVFNDVVSWGDRVNLIREMNK